jgi:rare lipoprotein A
MKNILLIGVFVSFIMMFNFTTFKLKHKRFKKDIVFLDTVKPKDSILIDTTDFTTIVYKKNVHASYYSDKLNGRKTASGQKFDNTKYTAAHKKLKFGTKVKVTNPATNKYVIVIINDRGPFTKGREIDLTKKAFMEIANNHQRGGLIVNLEIIE